MAFVCISLLYYRHVSLIAPIPSHACMNIKRQRLYAGASPVGVRTKGCFVFAEPDECGTNQQVCVQAHSTAFMWLRESCVTLKNLLRSTTCVCSCIACGDCCDIGYFALPKLTTRASTKRSVYTGTESMDRHNISGLFISCRISGVRQGSSHFYGCNASETYRDLFDSFNQMQSNEIRSITRRPRVIDP